ncbi:MAG: hypothetical protein KDA92_08100 [Planctomycetales bacterium]|nr:hypothetical protein [Planctomycetales bacterium]
MSKDFPVPILDAEDSQYPENLLSAFEEQPDDRKWWAVYTKARQEKALARQLVQMEVPFYLPLVPKENMIRGRRVKSHIPLFTGYVFVCGDEEQRVKSLTTNRISTMLPVDDQVQLLTDLRQIAQLIQVDAPLTVEARLTAGDPVRIKNGPMAGLEGVVITRRGQARLLVAVKMLQQGVSVEIEDFLLEPLR